MPTDETARYSRQTILPEIGEAGQERLRAARVLVVGVGGLGSPVATYLAAAGVGTLGLVDFDRVDLTNLHRQPLHATSDVGHPKLSSAAARLRDLNPNVRLELHETRLGVDNALEIIAGYDVVADGTDNFATRYLVNDACVLLGKPNAFACIYRFEGQLSVFDARQGPCYRCLFPEPPPAGTVPSCADAGVLGALPGLAGAMQASEVLKLILGVGEPMIGRFLTFDVLGMRFNEFMIEKDPNCPVCGANPSITELRAVEETCAMLPELGPEELVALMGSTSPPALLDVREDEEVRERALAFRYHIPLGDLEMRVSELDPGEDLVVYCRTGRRSAYAVEWLRGHGFPRVRNLRGGIVAMP